MTQVLLQCKYATETTVVLSFYKQIKISTVAPKLDKIQNNCLNSLSKST